MGYTYEGGLWNNPSYTFNYGEDGDVIHLPNGVQSVIRRDNTIYIEVNGGHLALQLGRSINNSGNYIKYTYDGSNVYKFAPADYASNYNFYDPRVTWYGFYYDAGTLYTYSDSFGNGYDIRLNNESLRAKNLFVMFDQYCDFVLFGNDLDNYIVDKSGNSQIWGGPGNDTLTGGNGDDTFYYNHDGGHDIITDANSNDTIFLWDDKPGDCSYYYDDANNIMHLYVVNGELEVNCSTGDAYYPMTYPVYQFADGTRLTYMGGGNWRGISWDSAEDIDCESLLSLFDDSGEFVYNYGDGRKDIFSTDNENFIFLNNMTLDQISSAEITNSGVNLKFNDGGALNVYGQTGEFIVNGENFRADYQNKLWIAES